VRRERARKEGSRERGEIEKEIKGKGKKELMTGGNVEVERKRGKISGRKKGREERRIIVRKESSKEERE
jgi:hypothetical protein